MSKRLFSAIFSILAFSMFSNVAKADVSANETYTVTIPEAVTVVLAADQTNFGTITSSDFGNGNTGAHVILVGDGTVAGSTSYVSTNDTVGTSARQFKIDFAGVDSSTYSLADNASYGVLTLTNSGSTASVNINLTDNAGTSYPELGDPAGTPVNFSVVTGSSGYLDIAASSNVPFDATDSKAPLSMKMDLDENSLSVDDAAGDISFQMTLSVVGIN